MYTGGLRNFEQADGLEFFNLLNEIAGIREPFAMIILGIIYVAEPTSIFIKRFPELASKENPEEGFDLIEKGFSEAEIRWKDRVNLFDTLLWGYQEVGGAYHNHTNKYTQNVRYSNYESGESIIKTDDEFLYFLKKKACYHKKALDVATHWEGLPSELLELFKSFAESSKKEYEAGKKMSDIAQSAKKALHRFS